LIAVYSGNFKQNKMRMPRVSEVAAYGVPTESNRRSGHLAQQKVLD